MITRYVLTTIFLGVLLIALASCDSAEITDSPSPQEEVASLQTNSPTFVQARGQLDTSLLPNSIDDIFVKLADRFDGFGGVYENEEGQLVIVSRQPENTKAARDELVAELFEMMEIDDKSRSAYLSRGIPMQSAAFSFTELAVHRDLIERNLRDAIPLVLTDVDERRNVVVIGLDETANVSTADVLSKVAQLGIPPAAIVIEQMPIPQAAIDMSPGLKSSTPTKLLPSITDYVRPLAGGLQIDTNGKCTLGIPVWYGSPGNQTRGFLTASHCTGFVGFNNGSQWGQPWLSNAIGTEFEDPPLTNCGPGSSNCHLTDAALIDLNSAHDNSSMTLPGHVYLTDFSSSTGSGGYTVTGETLPLGVQSPFMGLDVNKVGRTTGWTTGEITGTCVTISIVVRHPDGVKRSTRLPCYIRANTPVNGGDSGSGLFRIVYDPDPDGGNFLGILSACSGCIPNISTVAYYVSWAAISQAMNQHITMFEDQGIE